MDAVTGKRIDRRTFLRGSAVTGVGLATAAVIGCDDDDDDASTAPAAPAAPSGSTGGSTSAPASTPEPRVSIDFNIGIGYPGETLDPNSASRRAIEWHAIYETTARIITDPVTSKTTLEPSLATSWEVDQNDPRKWVFNLRDSEWSDGEKLTAEDVLFTVAYATDADNKSNLISRVNIFESGRVIDDRTVEFTTKTPDATWAKRLSLAFIIPKHFFEDPKKGPLTAATEPVGSGAYVASKYVRGSQIELEASPSSWRGTQGINHVNMSIITEHTTRLAAFEVNDVAMMDAVPITDLERVQGWENVRAETIPAFGPVGLSFQNIPGDPYPTVDPRVRLAINHAVDNELIADKLFLGTTVPMRGQMVPPPVLGFNPDLKPYAFDPDLARDLLSDAGFPDGFDTTIETHTLNAQAKPYVEVVAGFLAEVGISSNILTMDVATWRDGLYGRKDRTAIYNNTWNATAMYEASFALVWYLSESKGKYYGRPDFDARYADALTTFDDEERGKVYQDMFALMHDDMPGLFSLESNQFVAWKTDVLKDYVARVDPTIFLDSVTPA